MKAFPAYACAAANLVAVVALATLLAPGTSLVDEASRAAYVREHLLAWRLGWASWILAAISLLAFFAWWTARIRAPRWPLVLALAGFAADLGAESLLIAVVPDSPALAPLMFQLTGGVANGGYTIAGIALSLRTPGMRGGFALWTGAIWLLGILLSAFAFLEVPLGIAASTAALFTLFLPWCVAMGRRLS